ncbi:MAG: hypothetical protein HY547_02910 [Elusimicrobia bacterium]|nr:hypothetical protein [Elusimicrobiota bacterium]
MKRVIFLALPAAALCWPMTAHGSQYARALETMNREMQRSLKQLSFDDNQTPYFLLYRLSIIRDFSVTCSYGDIGWIYDLEQQIPFVESRVGSYDLDNTWDGFATAQSMSMGSVVDLDTGTLAHQFWHLTDTAYKNALRKYLEKKARLAQELEVESLPDFSREEPHIATADIRWPDLDKNLLMERCREASKEFRRYPEVQFGYVTMAYKSDIRLLVNSEGAQLIQQSAPTPYSFYITAEARASDGLSVDSYRSGQVIEGSALPYSESLKTLVGEVAGEVKTLKESPLATPEVAPALIDGESTGVFFHEALGHRLEGLRQREKNELQTFKGKVGERIIPPFLNLISDPSLEQFAGVALSGHYRYDSEGLPSRRVLLIEKGVLKNYLMSRRPIQGFLNSNGSGRSDPENLPEGRMSVLMVEPLQGVSDEELGRRFLAEIKRQGKPFGFHLQAMRSGEAQTGRGSSQSFISRPRLIYKVYPDGREELVRGLEYVGTPLVSIEKIIAAGKKLTVKNAYCGSSSGFIPVTQIAPAVIISEIELQRQSEDRFRPPILKSPIFQ